MPAPTKPACDPRRASRLDLLIGSGLGLLTFVLAFATEKQFGVPRDESFYFRAAHDYAGWFQALFHSPGSAFSDAVIGRYFAYNTEHPALMKELFGLSHLLFFDTLHWMRPIAAYRLPTFVLAGLFAAVLYLFGAQLKGRVVGIFAVLAFFLSPRDWFHAHLACFDFPVCATWLFVIYGYWRSETSRRWAWATGVLLGLALATKHNAFFLPPVLVLHWVIVRGAGLLRREGPVAFLKAIPLVFWAMAIVAPVVFYLHWPWIWHHPIDRVGFWIAFHLKHVNYAWYYLGDLMREPPFPLAYTVVVTALTVPLAIAVAMATGLLAKLGILLRSLSGALRKRAAEPLSSDDWLLVINAVASMAIIAPPSVPHFGGAKHWMASMPFFCILGGEALVRGARLLAPHLHIPRAFPAVATVLCVIVLAPAAWGLIDIGGYGTSYYNELAGGQAGAAALGMQRQFWSNNVTGVLPWLDAHAPEHARVFFHEVTYDSYRAYVENGMLRPDIQFAQNLDQADFACYQYHQEFRFWEYAIWTQLDTRWPVAGLYLDEVPNIECYQRGHAW